MSSAPRKRKASSSANSRHTRKRRAGQSSATAMATATETIEVEESEEVVDLTCESYEPVVVDLTHNDSVVIVEENSSHRRNRSQATSCILSSDEEDSRDTDVFVTNRVSRDASSVEPDGSRFSAGKVSCPICLDGYSEIVKSRRLIVSTKCGHIFCSQCIRDALKTAGSCPTCRKKLTHKQYHPIYI